MYCTCVCLRYSTVLCILDGALVEQGVTLLRVQVRASTIQFGNQYEIKSLVYQTVPIKFKQAWARRGKEGEDHGPHNHSRAQ